jgi:DNA repair/transcription protein MET18/MMS19
MNTKRDVLQTITASVTEYGPRTVSLYAITLWDALKFEVLNVQEEDLAQEALTALAAIARTLSQGTNGPLTAYLRPIIKECNEHLEDAPTKQSQASARILNKIADVSAEVTNILLAGVLPNLFTLFQTTDTMAKRRGLLEVLIQLIRANISVYGDWRTMGPGSEQAGTNALAQFRDQALEVMLNGLESAPIKEVSFRLVCLDGLVQLSKARQLMDDEDVGRIIQVLQTIVIHEESYGKDEVKEAAINGIVDIAHQKPQVVVDKAFPAFLAQLPDTDADGSRSYAPVLEAFAKLASEEKVFNTVLIRLKNKFSAAVAQGASSTYIVALLSAMLYALNKGEAQLSQSSESSTYYNDIALPLLKRASSSDNSHPTAFDDETTLDLVGRICNIIIRSQPTEAQNPIATELYTLFRGTPQAELPPFNLDAAAETHKTMVISTHLLASFRKDTKLPADRTPLISSLAAYTQTSSLTPRVRAASLRQLSLLINKYHSASELKTCMDPLISQFALFDAATLDPARIRIIFACLKAIALRSSPALNTLYPQLLALLTHPTHGTTVAHGFPSLLQPDDLLTKPNNSIISGLAVQKTFTLLVPALAANFRAATDATVKKNHLIALAGILKWTPFAIILDEIPALAALLLQSLDLRGADADPVKEAALGTLGDALLHAPAALEEHTGSLVARFLANGVVPRSATTPATTSTTNTQDSTPTDKIVPRPRVRALALQCLQRIPEQFGTAVVLPYRRQVVKRLGAALDDGKREVRAAAVRCRAKWAGVDEVGDED